MLKIKKYAVAGKPAASDCMVEVLPGDKLIINLESVAKSRFEEHLKKLINEVLKELEITEGHIKIDDHGALDYCIKARIITAVKRSDAE